MSSIGNLINPQYYERQSPEKPSLASALNSILLQKSEEERKQKILIDQEERKRQAEIAAEQRKFERSKTLMDLFNNKPVNNNVERAGSSLSNSEVGAKVVKVPSNAMMSLVGGGFGDIQGNQVDSPMDKLFTTAASQKDPFQTRMVMSGVNADLEPSFKMVDENRDLPQIQRNAVNLGIDPTGMNRTQILSESAKRKSVANDNKINKLSPSESNFKKKKFDEFATTYTDNKLGLQLADEAEAVLPNIPSGIVGNVNVATMKLIDPNNKVLADWQKVKNILTDITLLKTNNTKGAISDKEMALFKDAVANDDMSSMPRIKEALATYRKKIQSQDEGNVNSFYGNFKEDPRDLLPGAVSQQQDNSDPEYEKYLQAIGQ